MFPTSVDRSLREIASLKDRNPHLTSEMNHRIMTLQMELGFLKMFIWFLPRISRKKYYVRETVGKGRLDLHGVHDRALDRAASKLLQKVELCKPKIREDCLHLLDFSSQQKFSSSNELVQFISCTISNLWDLFRLKAGAIVSVEMQARDLIKKLYIFKEFLTSTGEWRIFSVDIQDYAYKTAYVSTIYWVDQMDEALEARMKAIISDLLQMVKFYSPEVTGLYIHVLRASKSSSPNNSDLVEAVASFVDFVLPTGFKKNIRTELIFLMALVLDARSPVKVLNAKQWNLVLTKAKALVSEIPSLISSPAAGGMNQEIPKKGYILLGDFQRKTHEVMAEVSKRHLQIPESSRHHFPATNVLGFTDFLLENLENLKEASISDAKFLRFGRDLIFNLHNELVSVRPSLTKLHDVQNEVDKLKTLWKKITYAVYQADYVIDSCQFFNRPIWHNVIFLRDVIEQIKFVKKQIKVLMANQTTSRIINVTPNSGSAHLGKAYTSRIDEVVVGFKDEEESIIEKLTRGSMKLDIVSIVGMSGQGKTTLANKVYNSPNVRYHFNKLAWCYVTQAYDAEKLLMDIFREIDDGIQNSGNQNLAEKVRKCLKGRKYLIIMDDIWDISAWNALKLSFPDDNNGSRVLFTSRNDFGCNPYLLRPLSEEDSMELLKQKLLLEYGWLSSFSSDAYKILKVCNGLPLAIVAVAGLLTKVSSHWEWSEIVENLNLKIANDGCMDILELSYKSLPGFLKPCFLYLGIVGQNKVFKVQKLIHLWIAEGFVQKSGIKTLEEVAKEYLEDLVSRSLIIVNKRNFSSGEIKECRIHDLMYEMCLRKAEQERFIHFPNSVEPIIYDQYRLCIYHIKLPKSQSITVNIRSLLFPPYNNCVLHSSFLIKLKFLRVLDLGMLYSYQYFPAEIVLLICLRYLSIRCEAKLNPPSIGNLCNLEFFHLLRRGTRSRIQFPHTIWKMKRLKDVDVGSVDSILLDDDYANVCPDQLCDLDSFSSLHISDVKGAERILRGFPRVRKLKLELSEWWVCRRDCDQFQVVLKSLMKLESLSLVFYRPMDHDCAFNLPITLKRLTLSGFNRPWSEISTIGKLPQLEVLKLLDFIFVGKRWDVEDEAFMNLKYLKLQRVYISHWEASTSSFPCFERIVVRDCPFLEELPSIFGQIATLKVIEIFSFQKSLHDSAERILSEQLEFGNEDFKVLTSNRHYKNSIQHLMDFRFKSVKYRKRSFKFLGESETDDIQKLLGLEEKGVIERYVDRSCVRSESRFSRRTKPVVKKYNCQPRQLIMSRHSKMQLKRDQ